jgi:hypothetical protein
MIGGFRDCGAASARIASPPVIYLVVGLDRDTMTPWHANVRARDSAAAEEIARARARALGIDLVVAAAIAPDT